MKKMYKYILIFILIMFGFVGEVRAAEDKYGCTEKQCEFICTKYGEDGSTFKIFKKFRISDNKKYDFMLSYEKDNKIKNKMLYTKISIFNTAYISPLGMEFLEKKLCPDPFNIYFDGKYCIDIEGVYVDPKTKDKIDTKDNFCTSNKKFDKSEKIKLTETKVKSEKELEAEDKEKKEILCSYQTTKTKDKIEVVLVVSKSFGSFGKDTKTYYVYKNGKQYQYIGLYESNFENFDGLKYASKASDIECPSHVYISSKKVNSTKKDSKSNYCFDYGSSKSDKSYCEKHFDFSADGDGLVAKKDSKSETFKNKSNDIGIDIPVGALVNSCYANKTCDIICPVYEKDGEYAFIYKEKNTDNEFYASFSWDGDNPKKYSLGSSPAFISEDSLKKMEDNECPKYMYADKDLEKEVCFDDDGEYCKGKDKGFETDQTEIEDTSGIMSDPEFEKTKPKDNNLIGPEVEELLKTNYGMENIMEICAFSKDGTKNPNVDQFFIVNDGTSYRYFEYHLSGEGSDGDGLKQIEANPNATDKDIKSKIVDIKYKSTCANIKKIQNYYEGLGGNQYNFWADNKDAGYYEYDYLMQWWHFGESSLTYEDLGPIETCEDLLGVDLINEINSYMLYIKVAVPILIIVLGSIDFGKAFIASDEDAMKKAQKRFMMRIMIGMVIFFIPSIVKILLNIANQVWGVIGSDTCGIMF